MPNSAGGFNSAIVPSKYETASEDPPAIAETYVAQGSSVTEFLTKCVISESDRRKVEMLTRGQSESIKWYQQRAGTLTTSALHRVRKIMNENS